ncbi:MAG TPA: hypothetical protein ENH99_01610 [Candidatus Pacearchaeota archaeon]|nr:hypothetical protein [Candidatus Pacearchaeota archaeon]
MPDKKNTIKGEIEGWGREPNKFRGGRGSLGIKVEGEWHNLIGKLEDLAKIQEKFPKGTLIQFEEEENKRGYLDIVEDSIKKIEKGQAYPEGKSEPSGKKEIDFAVCYKSAVEIQMGILRDPTQKPLTRIEVSREIADQTKQFYLDFQKSKEDLKKEGKW